MFAIFLSVSVICITSYMAWERYLLHLETMNKKDNNLEQHNDNLKN